MTYSCKSRTKNDVALLMDDNMNNEAIDVKKKNLNMSCINDFTRERRNN